MKAQSTIPKASTTQIFSRMTAKMLHRTTFMMDKMIERTLQSEAGITLSQFLMLMQMGGGEQCQRELAAALGVTPAAVSRQVSQLVAQGFIKRLPHEHDRRFEFLILTTKGKRTHERATKALEAEFSQVYQNLTPSERQAIHGGLTALIACYEAHNEHMQAQRNIASS